MANSDTLQIRIAIEAQTERINEIRAALGLLDNQLLQANQSTQALGGSLSTLANIGLAANTLKMAFDAVNSALDSTIGRGMRINQSFESMQIGIASVISASSKDIDALNNKLSTPIKVELATAEAIEAMQALKVANRETIATLPEITEAFQAVLAPARALGMSTKESIGFTKDMANAAASIGVPMHQLSQELRAVLEGDTSNNSRVNQILGIKKEVIEAHAAAGDLSSFLQDKLSDYAAFGSLLGQSMSGVKSNIADDIDQILATATSALFERTKGSLLDLEEYLGSSGAQIGEDLAEGIGSALGAIEAVISEIVNLGRVSVGAADSVLGLVGAFFDNNQAASSSLGVMQSVNLVIKSIAFGVVALTNTIHILQNDLMSAGFALEKFVLKGKDVIGQASSSDKARIVELEKYIAARKYDSANTALKTVTAGAGVIEYAKSSAANNWLDESGIKSSFNKTKELKGIGEQYKQLEALRADAIKKAGNDAAKIAAIEKSFQGSLAAINLGAQPKTLIAKPAIKTAANDNKETKTAIDDAKRLMEEWSREKLKIEKAATEAANDELAKPYIALTQEYEADLKKFASIKGAKEEIEEAFAKRLAVLNEKTKSKALDKEIEEEERAYAAKENYMASVERGLDIEAQKLKKVYEYKRSAIELTTSGSDKERALELLRHQEVMANLQDELRAKKIDPEIYQMQMRLENERFSQNVNAVSGYTKEAFDSLQGVLESGFFDVMTGKFKNLGDTFKNIFLNAGNSVAQSLSKSMSQSVTEYAKELITGKTTSTTTELLEGGMSSIDPTVFGDIANMEGSSVDGALITTAGGSIVDTATGKVTARGSDILSLPIQNTNQSSDKSSITSSLKTLDTAKTLYNAGSTIMSAGTAMVEGMGAMGISSGGTLGSIAGNVQGFGYGMMNPGIASGTGGATGAGAIAGQMAGGAAIGYAMGWAGDKIMGAQTQAANYAAIGGAIGSVIPVIGTVMGAAIGALIGGSMGTKKLDNAAIDIGNASAEAVFAQNRETYKTKSWYGVKTDVKTYDISEQQKTAIQKTFKAYDYLLSELDIVAPKLSVENGAFESVKDFVDRGITKAFFSATGAADTEAIYSAWVEYAKTVNKTITEALSEQVGIFIAEKRSFEEWSLGFSGDMTAALKYKAEYTAKDFEKLEESIGITGVTAENFAEKMDKSVKESLTPENIKNWGSLSAALKLSAEAQRAYENAIKETTKTVQGLIDSISNLSANTAVAYNISARNLRAAKEEFAAAFDVVAPDDIGNLKEYMSNLDISHLTDSQTASLQTLTNAYTAIDQAQKAYTATLQQTANTVNGMVESVIYRNATPDTKLALAKVNYQVVWGEDANASSTTEWYNLLKQKQAGLEEGTTFSDFQTKTLNDLGAALASVEDAAVQASIAATQTAASLNEAVKAELERRNSLIADIDAYIEQIGYRHASTAEKLALASVQFHASTGNITPTTIKEWLEYGEALKSANPTDANVESWKKLGQTLAEVQDELLSKAKEVEAAWKSAAADIETAIKALNPTIRSMSELQGSSVTLDSYKELLSALESSRQEEIKRAQEATDARLKSLEDEKRLIIDIQRIVQTMTERIIDVQTANNVSYKAELSKVQSAMKTTFNVDLTNVTSAANNYLNKYQEESTSRLDYIRQVASVRADFSSLTGQTHGTIESIERAIKEAQAALEYRLSEINNTAKAILNDWLAQAKIAQAEATNHTQMILNQIAAVQQEIFNKNLSVTVNPTPVIVTVTTEGGFGGASGGGGFTIGGGGSGTVTAPTIIPTVTPVAPTAPSVPVNEFYNAIDAAYRTVLGRGVTDRNDTTGLPYWTNALQSGGVSLANLVKSVAIGGVPEMYEDLQLSLASWAHDFWQSEILNGVVAPQNTRSAVANAKLVTDTYQAVLGRAPDQSGFAFWTDALVRGVQNPSTLKSDIRAAAIAAGEPTLFAQGGIVTKATNAIIGEAGYPEAVIPLKDGAGLKVDVGGVTAELRALRDEIRELKEVTIAVLDENQRLRSLIMQMSKNGSALNVELGSAA